MLIYIDGRLKGINLIRTTSPSLLWGRGQGDGVKECQCFEAVSFDQGEQIIPDANTVAFREVPDYPFGIDQKYNRQIFCPSGF